MLRGVWCKLGGGECEKVVLGFCFGSRGMFGQWGFRSDLLS